MSELNRLKELAEKLPNDLQADWRGTNHFELTTSSESVYWWLDLRDWADEASHHDAEGCGLCQRIGLLLDLAEEVSRLKPWLEGIKDE